MGYLYHVSRGDTVWCRSTLEESYRLIKLRRDTSLEVKYECDIECYVFDSRSRCCGCTLPRSPMLGTNGSLVRPVFNG